MSRFYLGRLAVSDMKTHLFTPAGKSGEPPCLDFDAGPARLRAIFLPRSISLSMYQPVIRQLKEGPGELDSVIIDDASLNMGKLSYPDTKSRPTELLDDAEHAVSTIIAAFQSAFGNVAKERYRLIQTLCSVMAFSTGAKSCRLLVMNGRPNIVLSPDEPSFEADPQFYPLNEFVDMKSALRHLRKANLERIDNVECLPESASGHAQMEMIPDVAKGFGVETSHLLRRLEDLRLAFEKEMAGPRNIIRWRMPDSIGF